jgi:uncharacterized membrane protein
VFPPPTNAVVVAVGVVVGVVVIVIGIVVVVVAGSGFLSCQHCTVFTPLCSAALTIDSSLTRFSYALPLSPCILSRIPLLC